MSRFEEPPDPITLSEMILQQVELLSEQGMVKDDQIATHVTSAIDEIADSLLEEIRKRRPGRLREQRTASEEFVARNLERWGRGLDQVEALRLFCIEAGEISQATYLEHEQYLHDPLLGSLLRLHAHGCRIAGEIVALLCFGYPDGAFARWRSLHENAVTAIILQKEGVEAANDYLHFGLVQAVNGMNGFQETDRVGNRFSHSGGSWVVEWPEVGI